MYRRKAPLLAALAATVALITTGCSGTGAPETESDSKLTVWHYYSVDGQVDGLNELASDFEADNSGVEVEYVYVPQDQMSNKLVQAAATGTGPDVILYNASWAYDLTEAGAIEPMDEWWNSFADKDQFPEAVIQKVDGDIMGVQGFVNLLGLWYNADILEEIGVEPPSTFDELEDAMAKAKAAGYSGIETCGTCGDWGGYPWLSMNGFSYKDPQVAPVQETFQMLQDWNDKGYISAEQSTWDQTVPFQTWSSGKSAFTENGNWQIQSAAENAKFDYGVVPLPVGDGRVYLGGEALNVGAFSSNKDLAYKYIQDEFMSTEGELTLLKSLGAIPARADAAADPSIAEDPILSTFATAVAEQGNLSPNPDIPTENVAKVMDLVNQGWSGAIAKTAPADQLAEQLVEGITPLIKR